MATISKINPEVRYYENIKIEDIDINHKSYVYVLDAPENGIPQPITVAIGKPQYKQRHNIVYFAIYAISRNRVRAQIGVFEVRLSILPQIYQNGEIDITMLDYPLLYSFSTPAYLAKLEAEPRLFDADLASKKEEESARPQKEEPKKEPEKIEISEEEEHLQFDIPEERLQQTKAEVQIQADKPVFEDIPDFVPKKYLPEETKKDAEKNNLEYKDEPKNRWIERFMRNNHYDIHEIESGSNSLFSIICRAFEDVGKKTMVEKLRTLIANEMTDAVFEEEYRKKYISYSKHTTELQKEIDEYENQMKDHKRKQKQMKDSVEESRKLMEEYEEMRKRRVRMHLKLRKIKEEQAEDVGFLEHIDTLEKMQKFIQTSNYRVDTWAITTLERILEIKLIIFSQSVYEPDPDNKNADEPKDLDGVLMCGYKSPEFEQRKTFNPKYYIMVSCVSDRANGDQYSLITYKDRIIFTFLEIPYDVKIKILKRCLTSTSGIYYLIEDFRNLKTQFAIDEDAGVPEDYHETPEAGELYDPDTKFIFYARSAKLPKPGAGEGETIPSGRVAEFAPLAAKDLDWRKKLDDEWDKTPILIDQHRWTSVAHYMQAIRYKDQNPDIYLMFSLDTDTELAKSVKEAKAFKGRVEEAKDHEVPVEEGPQKKKKPAQKKARVIAPAQLSEDRIEQERKAALLAKFRDNAELGNILKFTKDAMLLHALPKQAPEPDILLMKVRQEISS